MKGGDLLYSGHELGAVINLLRADPEPAVIYIMGRSDTGKSWLAEKLLESLAPRGPAALLDADPGQSVAGIPGTLALSPVSLPAAPPVGFPPFPRLRFIGSLTPAGNLLRMIGSLAALGREASRLGFTKLVVDSSGFVSGSLGSEFQSACIDALDPGYVILTGNIREYADLLPLFSGGGGRKVISLDFGHSPSVKTPRFRKAYREALLSRYFSGAVETSVSLAGTAVLGAHPSAADPEAVENLLCAFADASGFVTALCIARRYDAKTGLLEALVPEAWTGNPVCMLTGSFRADPDELGLSLGRGPVRRYGE